MAFRIANKEPLDLATSTGVGVSIPFSGPAAFNTTYTTAEQLKSNITNYIMTSKGERFLNPNFGSNIKRTVFESITGGTLDTLQSRLTQDLVQYFPLITVNKIDVYGKEDSNEVKVEITYTANTSRIPDTINVIL